MGMDVIGKDPKNKRGEYFRNNCWYWRPLWIYCGVVAPRLTEKVRNGQTNDGDGLGARDSVALADALELELKSGQTKAFEVEYRKQNEAIPDKVCQYCDGTGDRKDLSPPEWKKKCNGCNACDGKGKVRPSETWYYFAESNVREFVGFLRNCGGFKIL